MIRGLIQAGASAPVAYIIMNNFYLDERILRKKGRGHIPGETILDKFREAVARMLELGYTGPETDSFLFRRFADTKVWWSRRDKYEDVDVWSQIIRKHQGITKEVFAAGFNS